MSKKKAIIITVSSIGGVLAILAGTFFIYTGIYYHADKDAIELYMKDKNVTVTDIGSKTLEIKGNSKTQYGIIYYPGAKVEYTSYTPLLASLAEQGYLCLSIHMPFNLPIFDPYAANSYPSKYPEITKWYLMGHSLGGVMAAQCLASSYDNYYYDGLIMLGSFPNNDLSSLSIRMLSIYGSEDNVLNKAKYEGAKSKWPAISQEYVIEGGCHSYFGMYGMQKGDGTPTISNAEQIALTTAAIKEYIHN